MTDTGLQRIVGEENILKQPELLEEYTDQSGPTPNSIVRPADASEVQEIVTWANETGTPLVPVSSGPPHHRGDTASGAKDVVIVDLGRMNKIVRIDKRNRLAMVEPGVTFGQLQSELAKEGLTAYLPLLPRNTKSVIGSVLEREPIPRPAHHWDSTDPLLCAEVVFGSGERFRTGEASGPDTIEEQWEMDRVQMNPFGHSHVDFQRLLSGAQGTIGIVTWITLKCNYLSELSRPYFVTSSELEPLFDLSYQLLKYRFGGYLFILNNLNLACLMEKTSDSIEKLRKALPPWILFTSFEGYGILPQDKVNSEEADFKSMAAKYELNPVSEIADVNAQGLAELLSDVSPEPYWKTRVSGDFEDIFFLTTLDKTPEFVSAARGLSSNHDFSPESIGVYIQPIVQGTSCHCEFNLYHDSNEKQTVQRLVTASSEKIADMGGFFSRPYPAWKDIAYRHATGTAAMQRKVKQIFDPDGILNPGKLCF